MLERLLHFSIHHRYPVVMLTLAAAAAGVFALARLPIDAVPDITNNQVQINALAPSLSPLEVEQQVTFPVETALAGIRGLEYTRSLSRNGFAQVTAVFEEGVDIYFARQQIAERLAAARDDLPPGVEPAMGAISTGLGEVYMWTVEYAHPHGQGATPAADGKPGWQRDGSYLTPEGQRLSSELEQAAYLRTVQDWIIAPQLKGLKDVAAVDTVGGFVKQYHVRPDPMKLVAYGLTFTEIIEALERNNASVGAGYVERKGEAYLVRASGRIESPEQIEDVVLDVRNGGTPVRIRDVATVGVGRELRTGSASKGGEEVVIGTVLMLIGANSRTVAADVDARMREINQSLPPGVVARTIVNRTKLVDATIRTVRTNLFEGAILVVVVLLLMLGNIRAAVITALAIPLSMLLTATGMVFAGVSGNLMSLGAIDFGLIVDGSVIIVENCLRVLAERQRELGRPLTTQERLATVFAASRQVRGATAFGEAIIIIVYLPILFLTGTEGKMFKPMAITVIFALIAAFVLSLTFVPAMVAIVVRGRVKERENVAVRWSKRAYEPMLRWAVRGRWVVVPLAVAAFGGSLLLFASLGQEFIPTLDELDLAIEGGRMPSVSLTQSQAMQSDVERRISQFPEVAYVFSKTGTAEMATDAMPVSSSDTFIMLKPRDQWPDPREPKARLVERMEEALEQLPGNAYEFSQPIQLRFNELLAGVRSDVAVKVYGDDFDEMVPAAEAIARVLRTVPGAADVRVEQTEGLPVMNVDIDRRAIARYGLNVADVQDVVAAAVGGREAGVVFEGDRRFDLVVRLPDEIRQDLDALANLPVPLPRENHPGGGHAAESSLASAGPPQRGDFLAAAAAAAARPGYVPLYTVANIEVAEGANQVSRENGKRRGVVQANVRGGRDLGSFVAEAQRRIAAEAPPPAGNWVQWGGQFENLIAARRRLAVVVPACFFLIFLLLFSTFGGGGEHGAGFGSSVRYALLVFTGVPLALTGGIVALWLRGMPFSIPAAVGFIALSGVAVLNGLVMVTFINQLRRDGATLDDAILRGSLTRLRPVLMTALVASLGFVPMALSEGTGAEVQKPLATVVIGGIVSSTFLTLLVLPALYRMWHRREASGNEELRE